MGLFGNIFKSKIVAEVTVFKGDGILITVDGDGEKDRGFSKEPYIKIYNNETATKANKVATLKIEKPEYMKKHNRTGLEEWKLNGKEMKMVLKDLKSKPNVKEGKDYETIWETIINVVNTKYNCNLDQDISIPNYKNLI